MNFTIEKKGNAEYKNRQKRYQQINRMKNKNAVFRLWENSF
jgi:hypothetical protein